MTTPAPVATEQSAVPPPMPSIAAAALLESQLLVDRLRRVVLAWLTRD